LSLGITPHAGETPALPRCEWASSPLPPLPPPPEEEERESRQRPGSVGSKHEIWFGKSLLDLSSTGEENTNTATI